MCSLYITSSTSPTLSEKLQRLNLEQPRVAAHIEHQVDVFLAMSRSEISSWLSWLDTTKRANGDGR